MKKIKVESKSITFDKEYKGVLSDFIALCPCCKRAEIIPNPGIYELRNGERIEIKPTTFDCNNCGAKFEIEFIYRKYAPIEKIECIFEAKV